MHYVSAPADRLQQVPWPAAEAADAVSESGSLLGRACAAGGQTASMLRRIPSAAAASRQSAASCSADVTAPGPM